MVMQALAEPRKGYHGRVRTGCLTCRIRKVKCDERRPVCRNCHRLDRPCGYGGHTSRRLNHSRRLSSEQSSSPGSVRESRGTPRESRGTPNGNTLADNRQRNELAHSSSPPSPQDRAQNGSFRVEPANAGHEATFMHTSSLSREVESRLSKRLLERESTSQTYTSSDFISRDIQLTTTMDLLAVQEDASQPALDYFIESVSCPAITPFDSSNWQQAKREMVEMSKSLPLVNIAVLAASGMHKCQVYGLTPTEPMILYKSARNTLEELCARAEDGTPHDFEGLLVASFLLCFCELVYSSADLIPSLRDASEAYVARLQAWAQRRTSHSPLCIRLTVWLRILHWTTLRGGCMGLISERVYAALPNYDQSIPKIQTVSTNDSVDLANHVFGALSEPMFEFYLQLQLLSGSIAKLTHYHRSRSTGADQDEVLRHIDTAKTRLRALWDTRGVLLRRSPEELRTQLAPGIAKRIITLVGLCSAAYLTEFVELDRVRGDPVSKWTDSRPALQGIRDIVEGEWEAYIVDDQGLQVLNPGLLRPLFLYAIECMDAELAHWAADRIGEIRCKVHRSEFFSAFARELSTMQLRKERRVTSKFFCIWAFGVPPPFL